MPFDYGVGKEEWKVLDPGRYTLEIVGVKETTTKKDGHNMVAVNVKAVDGPLAGLRIPFQRIVFWPEGHKNHWITKSFLRALGALAEGSMRVDPASWVGKRIVGDVEIEDWGGNQRNKVRWWYPVPVPVEEVPF